MPLRPVATESDQPPAPPARFGSGLAFRPAAAAPVAQPPRLSRRARIARRIRGAARAVRDSARRGLPFVTGAAALLVALLVFNQVSPPPAPLSQRDVKDAITKALASQTPAPPFSVAAYQAVAASVVLIQVNAPSASPGAGADEGGRLGTGVVVSDAGLILTSNHVIAGATAIQVTFADGTKAAAQIVSQSPANDTAVITAGPPPQGIPAAVLGNPNRVQVGDEAFVIGSPFGLYSSLSAGVVSALDRSFQVPDSTVTLTGLIQVDAAVNPGNSGGPLVNRDGQVIGIVAALINPTKEDVFVGIGLAVPITAAGGGAGLPPY